MRPEALLMKAAVFPTGYGRLFQKKGRLVKNLKVVNPGIAEV